MRRGLYVGRFQLFHNGHIGVIKYIDSQQDIDEIIIGIGSSQYDNLNKSPAEAWSRNPFTFEERKEMIKKSLEGIVSKPYSIVAVPDLHNYPLWLQRLEENLPKFQKVFTSVEYEWKYFLSRGYEVSNLPKIPDISGTMIRAMLNNGEDISSYVPPGTQQVLERIAGAERVRQLYEKDLSDVLNGKPISPNCS